MADKNTEFSKLMAEARAIHFSMRYGQITYEEAKRRVQPILRHVNNHVEQVAKRCGVSPKYITFQDLGRVL